MRWFYAGYKKGAMDDLLPPDLDPQEFRGELEDLISRHPIDWVFKAPTKHGIVPVGFAWPLTIVDTNYIKGMIIAEMRWFAWASRRNVLESALNFFNELRDELNVIEFAREKDKPFFDHLCKYGIMQSKGFVPSFYEDGEGMKIYITRKSKWA